MKAKSELGMIGGSKKKGPLKDKVIREISAHLCNAKVKDLVSSNNTWN